MSMFENPWAMMGLGLLAANQPGRSLGQVLGHGGTLAMQNMRLGQQHAQKMAEAREKEAERKRQLERSQNIAKAVSSPEFQSADLSGRQAILAPYMPEVIAKQSLATPEKTALQQNLIAAGLPEGSKEYQQAILERTKKGPLATTKVVLPEQKQQTKEAETVGGYYGQAFIDTQKAEREARAQNARLDRLGKLFDETYTGLGGKGVLAAKKALSAIGVDVSGIAEGEAGAALANEMAMQLRNPAGGAGMPGSMSDGDRKFLEGMTPGLSTTKEGRKLMIETRKKLNQRSMEVAKMARQYRRENGSLDEGFFDALAAWSNENEMFSDKEKSSLNFMQEPNAGGTNVEVVDWADLPSSSKRGRNRLR